MIDQFRQSLPRLLERSVFPWVDTESVDDNIHSLVRKELIVVLEGFEFQGDDEWEEGTIYDPNNGKTYSCIITMEDKETIEVRGFIGFSLIGRTVVWTRYNEGE